MVVQPGLCGTWSETPKSGFLTTKLIFVFPFQLLGCAILGVGIWVLFDKNFSKYVDNSEHFNMLYTGAYVFIAVGLIIMIVGFFGCCGAIRENQCMLGTVGHIIRLAVLFTRFSSKRLLIFRFYSLHFNVFE